MQFPVGAMETVCKGCPNKDTSRTKGFYIQKRQGKYVHIDFDASSDVSVVILFRDPTINDPNPERIVRYVLDVDDPKTSIHSRLFTFYDMYFLNFFPDDIIVYLDNFIRCKMPYTLDKLNKDYLNLSNPYATCCCKISRSFLEKLPNLKCLIISDVKPVVWLGKKDFITTLDKKTNEFIATYKDQKPLPDKTSTILLNQCFYFGDIKLPVFFFPHPNTMQLQYKRSYAPRKKHSMEFQNHIDMILNMLK